MSDAQDEYENKKPFEFSTETSELETKPNRTFNLYPNVIVKQRDTVLKTSKAKKIHNPTFHLPKQKTKLTSKHFENPIPKIFLNENPTKNDPNKKQISKITVDSFINELVEFEETVISKGNDFLSAQQVLQREFESRNLPPIELKRFDGNLELWPEFIERVHRMASSDNNLKMDRLLSVLDGDTKCSIQLIRSNGIFYATALKPLKCDYGNPIIVSHVRVKSLLNSHR